MYEKHIQEIENFCIRPFVGLNVNPDGSIMHCCEQDPKFFSSINYKNFASVRDIFNSELFQSVRSSMLAGERHPSCRRCWDIEDRNEDSIRIIANRDYIEATGPEIKTNVTDLPSQLDLRISNKCNLKCRMCHAGASNKIAEEQFQNNSVHEVSISKLLIHCEHYKDVKLLGGEPTMDEQNLFLLKSLLDKNKKDVRLFITTNATTARDEWYETLQQFDTVILSFSVDSPGYTNEYIRSNSNYNKIKQNIRRYQQVGDSRNWSYTISQTVQIYNIHDYYKLKEDIYKDTGIDVFDLSLVTMPEYLSLENLPYHIKRKYQHKENYPLIKKILHEARSDEQCFQHMFNFVKYTNHLDMIRNTRFADINPELWYDISEFIKSNWYRFGKSFKGRI